MFNWMDIQMALTVGKVPSTYMVSALLAPFLPVTITRAFVFASPIIWSALLLASSKPNYLLRK